MIVAYVLSETDSMAELEHTAQGISQRCQLYNHGPPGVFFTDQCCAEYRFLCRIFPSLADEGQERFSGRPHVVACVGLLHLAQLSEWVGSVVADGRAVVYPLLEYDRDSPAPMLVATVNDAAATTSDLLRALRALPDAERYVAFDQEWPTAKKGEEQRPVAIIQIACPAPINRIFIYQIARMRASSAQRGATAGENEGQAWQFPPQLRMLLEDDTVLKVGANIGADSTKLNKDYGFTIQGTADVRDMAFEKHLMSTRTASLDVILGAACQAALRKDPAIRSVLGVVRQPACHVNESDMVFNNRSGAVTGLQTS